VFKRKKRQANKDEARKWTLIRISIGVLAGLGSLWLTPRLFGIDNIFNLFPIWITVGFVLGSGIFGICIMLAMCHPTHKEKALQELDETIGELRA
jgi:phosphotransferase system  glucose/maltose/N-acetylglucosamine-specific IIC component